MLMATKPRAEINSYDYIARFTPSGKKKLADLERWTHLTRSKVIRLAVNRLHASELNKRGRAKGEDKAR